VQARQQCAEEVPVPEIQLTGTTRAALFYGGIAAAGSNLLYGLMRGADRQ